MIVQNSSLLDESRRQRDLAALRTSAQTEVLVIGGGITGAGVALDAAARGMQVTLVEAEDLAHGTSRWSSKLVHGGLRYLASGHLDVALESARERDLLMTRIAPHLIRPLPTLIPHYGDRQAYVNYFGLRAGDALRAIAGTPRSVLPRARFVDPRTALRMAPGLRAQGLRGAIVGWDGQVEDDARLVIAAARTAASFGARILTGVTAISVGDGRATLADEEGEFEISCDHVISCTGVWTGQLNPAVRLQPSRGTHLIVASERLGHPTASMTVPVPGQFGRFVFAIPQRDGQTFVGLTDTPTESLQPDPPAPDADEVSWLREQISAALEVPLRPEDVLGTYSGLRPLVAADAASTADISRKHLVQVQPNGVIAVTGGKLTTYRRMAQDAVDLISSRPCPTPDIALVGAPGDARSRDRLVRRFGSEAPVLRQMIDRDARWGQLVGDSSALAAEVRWARMAEGARTPAQAADTRLRITLTQPRNLAAVEAVWNS